MAVIDASVALALVLPDEPADDVENAITVLVNVGALAPTLWPYEVVSGIRNAERRGRLTSADADLAIALAHEMPLEFVHPRGAPLLELSRRTGLTPYDASYLAVCLEHGLPLLTFDARLAQAAVDSGVALVQ